MDYKIVSDSSSNLRALPDVAFASVALKIGTAEKEYVDDAALDVEAMVDELEKYRGRSGSSCPNIHEWLEAFGDAQGVFAVTISSNLSGSYASACQAAEEYMQKHPDRRVCVIDSLSAGPELQLIAEKLRECILAGMDFDAIEEAVRAYRKRTHTLFCLRSMKNLARNGRVSPAVAKIAGVLGIQPLGAASDHGTLEMLHKCRGEHKALETIVSEMLKNGFGGGKVRISHCLNLGAAGKLRDMIHKLFAETPVEILPCAALCSFYAERGGLIVGYEGK